MVACSTFIVRFVADRGLRSFSLRVAAEVPDGVAVSPGFVVVVVAAAVAAVVVVVKPPARLLMMVAVVAVILFNNFAA